MRRRICQEKAPPVDELASNNFLAGSQKNWRQSKRCLKGSRIKNNSTYKTQKNEISNGTDYNRLQKLCNCLQKSTLKVLRKSNEKCSIVINPKRPSNVLRIRKSGRRYYKYFEDFGEPKEIYVKVPQENKPMISAASKKPFNRISSIQKYTDSPPTLPPRKCFPPPPLPDRQTTAVSDILPAAILSAPPLPPLSDCHRQNLASATTATAAEPLKQHPDDGHVAVSLQYSMQSLNLRDAPSAALIPSDYRHSPSSGFYSYSNSVGSCSPLPAEQNANKMPVIVYSVTSTRVVIPQSQTAIAPPPPPPYPSPTSASAASEPASRLTAAPPSYAASAGKYAAPRNAACATTPCAVARHVAPTRAYFCTRPAESAAGRHVAGAATPSAVDDHIRRGKPPAPAPHHRHAGGGESPVHVGEVQRQCSVLEWPGAAAGVENPAKLRNHSPQAFKSLVEVRLENLQTWLEQRENRRQQLEDEMQKLELGEPQRAKLRQILRRLESNHLRQKRVKMKVTMFEELKLIGGGAFGKVTLVCKKDTAKLYAMKTLRKADVLQKNQIAHVNAERDILAEADNEWVVKLFYSFQDEKNLYLVMEYIPGGDLMSLLMKLDTFDEDSARFYLAELICALESVHNMGFIHRDIKPDNILINLDGHIKLTDFGLCTGFRRTHNTEYYEIDSHNCQDSLGSNENGNNDKDSKFQNSKPSERKRRREHQRYQARSLVGTPNYIAPEVLLQEWYTQMCDWWSVGVVLFEMLFGYPPFFADTLLETQRNIIDWPRHLQIPADPAVSPEAVDLILKLCTDQERRIGKNTDNLRKHPFLASINFQESVRKLKPPYIPKIDNPTDTSNFDISSCRSYIDSSHDGQMDSKQFHVFSEFTFKRFFDDVGEVPLPNKTIPINQHNEMCAPIYV